MEAQKQTMELMATVPCKYRTGRVLGRGTYAVVKELVHIETGKRYAGKIISKAHMRGHQQVIRNEINILKKLARKHQNIISLVDYFETPHNVYLVMELCSGGELFDHIRCKQVFTENDAASIVRQIVEGVSFLHSHGIVHRDLKTENCLVKNKGTGEMEPTVAIADFGMARALALDDKNGTRPLTSLCGTPGYMAPEMVSRLGYGKPVDMWAIGVIAYFVLSGANPFTRESPRAEMHAVVNCEYSFAPQNQWERISPLAKSFISSLLVYSPEKRMTARQALAHPWLRGHTTAPLPSPDFLQDTMLETAAAPQAIRPAVANNDASSGTISGKIDTRANVFSTASGVSDSDIPSAQNAYTVAAAALAAAAANNAMQEDEDEEMTDAQPESGRLSSSVEREFAKFQFSGKQQKTPCGSSGLVLRLRNPKHANNKALCVDTKRCSTMEFDSDALASTTTNTTLTSPAFHPMWHGFGATECTTAQAIPIKRAAPVPNHPLVDMTTGMTPGNLPQTCLLTPVASIAVYPPSFGSETSPPHYKNNF
ncbi:Calcium/calmodulin-dependent protein kinase type I [Coemansia sp. RSA 2399]|nr:Calcium/calmodulin-dependent protein kinase type I [Coemansia sp. RSA 2399]KAJ1904956.1 Calcium/calmodulin-dependent protein kinase type I [Coemansia sp. IMI 209127]